MGRHLAFAALAVASGCAGDPSGSTGTSPAAAARECELTGETCLRFGRTGTCLDERCILPSGRCSTDVDCDDGNPCTTSHCDEGSCVAREVDGICPLDEGQGTCVDRYCAPSPPGTCRADTDCPTLDHSCEGFVCVQGACTPRALADGEDCRLPSGRQGTCGDGDCLASFEGEARNERSCVRRVGQDWYGSFAYDDCTPGLRYRLEDQDLRATTAALEQRVFEDLRYDMKVVLVPLADGGYNLVMYNRHDRSTVQGLVDPSFVAFTVASFTSTTSWRSRQLQVWLDPDEEGWAISTAGSRFAIQKGRASSGLGWLGVVDVPAFRNWLQRSFRPLPAVAPRPEVVAPGTAAAELAGPSTGR